MPCRENEPLAVTMETGVWAMFGITWDGTSGDVYDVTIYKDGEIVLQSNISPESQAGQLEMSVGNGTCKYILSE